MIVMETFILTLAYVLVGLSFVIGLGWLVGRLRARAGSKR